MSGEQPGGLYEYVPVGCVRPTCREGEPYVYVFDGTESILAANPQYTLTRNYTSFYEGKFQLACPSGSSIGYINNAPRFVFDPLMRIMCDTDCWNVYISGTRTGKLQPVKIGCFEK
ncbi:hypothetical protein PENTCL1PPCAC_17099, partial [Pristionchus entomophagus]